MMTPVLRARSPASPVAPTFHCRPISSATSAGTRPFKSRSVTTTISPRDFARTSCTIRSIRASVAAGMTFAKSLTNPTGCGSWICASNTNHATIVFTDNKSSGSVPMAEPYVGPIDQRIDQPDGELIQLPRELLRLAHQICVSCHDRDCCEQSCAERTQRIGDARRDRVGTAQRLVQVRYCAE